MLNHTAPSASPTSSKCNVDVAPLLDVQELLRRVKIKLTASWVQNGNKTARKNETLIFLLSTLVLPYSPPQDGDMSKLTPVIFIRKENDLELDYFNRLINPVLKTNIRICLNGFGTQPI